VDRFTADDFVAVSFLSVNPPPAAARELLSERAGHFSTMLAALGQDLDLADMVQPMPDDWIGWHLMKELCSIRGVNTTIASKLLARKRPRLRPVWDSVVSRVTGTETRQWEPLRLELRKNDRNLHHRLVRLRDAAGLPDEVTILRVFDVICWCEGTRWRPTSTVLALPPRTGPTSQNAAGRSWWR
jgi:hypothetical protein